MIGPYNRSPGLPFGGPSELGNGLLNASAPGHCRQVSELRACLHNLTQRLPISLHS